MLRLKSTRGFTLVELMITLALLAIVATIAVPNFVQFIRNNQVQAKADELKTFLQYARGQAVTKRNTYSIAVNGAALEVQTDNHSTEPDQPAKVVDRRLELNPAQALIRSSPSPLAVSFISNGAASHAVKITVCYENDFANGYLIEVKSNGMAKMYARGYKNEDQLLESCTP